LIGTRLVWLPKDIHTQTEGIEYFEGFSSVVKITAIRFILSLASAKGWILHQLDVNNDFLHGDLDEEIYMTPPVCLTFSRPMQVCKLRKIFIWTKA